MRPEDIQKIVQQWYGHIGTKGGQNRSDKKREAVRKSLEKARRIRMERRLKGESK